MNYRRGAFRLWIVLALIWVIGAGAFSYQVYRVEHPWSERFRLVDPEMCKKLEPTPPDIAECERKQAAAIAGERRDLFLFGGLVLIPPIVVLVLGWAGFWIARGFR